jgi:hypothetical protein
MMEGKIIRDFDSLSASVEAPGEPYAGALEVVDRRSRLARMIAELQGVSVRTAKRQVRDILRSPEVESSEVARQVRGMLERLLGVVVAVGGPGGESGTPSRRKNGRRMRRAQERAERAIGEIHRKVTQRDRETEAQGEGESVALAE